MADPSLIPPPAIETLIAKLRHSARVMRTDRRYVEPDPLKVAERYEQAAEALEAAATREQQLPRSLSAEIELYRENPEAWQAEWRRKQDFKVGLLTREQALRTALEWQPIETAPKDGTWCVLWVPCDDPADGGDVITAAYATFNDVDHRDGWRNNVNGYEVEGCPTRWMPLRAPPEAR